MGKKLDRLLGRGFRTSKFKPLLKLAVSRVTVLRNQHKVRVSQSRSDVSQLLQLGHHDRALIRVEQVIREQNMLDVYAMVEGYCGLLAERVNLIEQEKLCPEELKEAMSSLIFVATRCGELPELREVHRTLASRYGKEFAAQAVDLRNGCAVSPKIIQKLSARQPPLEIRTKLIREIASEYGIALPLEDATNQEDRPSRGPSGWDGSLERDGSIVGVNVDLEVDESDSLTRRMEFKDVADAAQVAFESAAYAAAAARAAVELSRSRSQSHHPDQRTSPGSQRGSEYGEESKQSMSYSRSNSTDHTLDLMAHKVDPTSDEESYFDESDDETESNHFSNNMTVIMKARDFADDVNEDRKAEVGSRDRFSASSLKSSNVPRLDLEKKPISVRMKQLRGY